MVLKPLLCVNVRPSEQFHEPCYCLFCRNFNLRGSVKSAEGSFGVGAARFWYRLRDFSAPLGSRKWAPKLGQGKGHLNILSGGFDAKPLKRFAPRHEWVSGQHLGGLYPLPHESPCQSLRHLAPKQSTAVYPPARKETCERRKLHAWFQCLALLKILCRANESRQCQVRI